MIDLPRLVKRIGPGGVEYLRVETRTGLEDALAGGWLLRLMPAGVDAPPVVDLPTAIEVPRLLKKDDGGRKRVETPAELVAALADGWLLRLDAPGAVVAASEAVVAVHDALDAPAGAGEAQGAVDIELAGSFEGDGRTGDATDELADLADEPALTVLKRGPGRPRKT